MNYPWMDAYCLEKKGAEKDYKPEWEATRYMIDGKMFLMEGENKEKEPIVSLKLEPAFGNLMRQEYPGQVVPGYYMNKEHWNSVLTQGSVPDEALKDMIDRSYALILGSLSKKRQKEILGE